jgi:hypothetical protein
VYIPEWVMPKSIPTMKSGFLAMLNDSSTPRLGVLQKRSWRMAQGFDLELNNRLLVVLSSKIDAWSGFVSTKDLSASYMLGNKSPKVMPRNGFEYTVADLT